MNISFLRPLYGRRGPWASVYLDASRDTESGGKEFELRWRAAKRRLNAADADEASVDALERALAQYPSQAGDYGLAAFAARGEVGLIDPLPAPPRQEIASFETLPHAMPLVSQRGERIAWLRVVVDRTGADLVGATTGGQPRTARFGGGQGYPIRKANPGGWSQPRYQRSAEVTWERNAAEIAGGVTDLADSVGAEVIVVGGDQHARSLLAEYLPERWQGRLVVADAGAEAEELDDVTARAIADAAAAHTAEAVDRFRTQLARDAAAGSGLPAVVSALQRGQVDTLLIVDDPSSTAQLWIGPRPTHVAMTADELRAMGVSQPEKVRADAALVRALACSDADLVLIEPGAVDVDGGVGAVLRYSDAATRHR
jgi:hypothetical protein